MKNKTVRTFPAIENELKKYSSEFQVEFIKTIPCTSPMYNNNYYIPIPVKKSTCIFMILAPQPIPTFPSLKILSP